MDLNRYLKKHEINFAKHELLYSSSVITMTGYSKYWFALNMCDFANICAKKTRKKTSP
jgi:hypothetical protein